LGEKKKEGSRTCSELPQWKTLLFPFWEEGGSARKAATQSRRKVRTRSDGRRSVAEGERGGGRCRKRGDIVCDLHAALGQRTKRTSGSKEHALRSRGSNTVRESGR